MDAGLTDIIRGNGLVLERLTAEKAEILRQWRNSPEVQQYMIFRGYITEEMQKKWFLSVSNDQNLYYIVSSDGEDIGYVHIKDIKDGCGELGSLIYSTLQRGKGIGSIANWLMICYAFDQLKLDRLFIHVLEDNERSFRMYKNLGFVPNESSDGGNGVLLCQLERSAYIQQKQQIQSVIEEKIHSQKQYYDTVQ